MKHSILKSTVPPEIRKLKNGEPIFGASPPAVFVGHVGYPKVNIGPLLPIGEYAKKKDTEFLNSPESWFGKSISDIVGYRSGMIRSNFSTSVRYQDNIEETLNRLGRGGQKLLEATQELTLASKSVDTEAKMTRVRINMNYDNHSQPQGPTGIAQEIKVIDNVSPLKVVDKVVSDRDLKAADAITGYLFKSDEVSLTSMQRLFSTGLLGVKKNRKLVPTRWTITAVDDIIGKEISHKLHHFPEIDKYYTFYDEYLDNKFLILLIPGPWSYEMNECWNQDSIWNQYVPGVLTQEMLEPRIMNDYEFERGRKNYASNITGAYYAARKEIEEFLLRERKQARAIVFREVSGGYIVPLGVWVIRETIRHAFTQGWNAPHMRVHETLKSGLSRLKEVFQVPYKYWIQASHLIPYIKTQTNLYRWMKPKGNLS